MKTEETQVLLEERAPRAGARRTLGAILALGAVGAIVAIAVLARSGTDALAELRVRDDVVDVIAAGPVREEGTEGKDLAEGDSVRTDGTGRAQIDFFDGSLTRMDNGTEVALRDLADTSDGRRIVLSLASGRTWNRVAEQRSAADGFVMRVGDATVSVKGTTFFVDCRSAPRCYVVGIDGSTEVASAGAEMTVSDGDCVLLVAGEAPSSCNERKLGLLDGWVRENLAEDQQLELSRVTTPSPTPSPSVRPFVRAPAPVAPASTSESTPTPTPKVTPKATEEPKKTDAPSPTPTRKKRTPAPNTPPPGESPTPPPTGPDLP